MMPIAHQRKLLLAIALLWTTCYGWPTGPPDNDEDVCRTRLPRHGVPPQTSPSPYVITTDTTTYQPGSLIRVTIESSFLRNFRGFYIQARLATDTGLVLDDKLQLLSDRALGEFVSPLPQGTKLHSCTQGLNNAVSHSQNTDKSSVTVLWRAPSRPEPWIDQQRYPEPWIGPIRFVATVVEFPREVFWTNTYSDIIREDISWCASSPCLNGGTCFDGINGYTCQCLAGWTGFNCDIPGISWCESSPCLNGGLCTDTFNGYRCTCLAGLAGVRCQININECASTPCMNGGLCFDGINGYTCQCLAGWTGVYCDSPALPNSCVPNPCPNSQICTPNGDSFTCSNDLIPPVVTCPNDVFRTAACNTGGIQVTYQVPIAVDNSGTVTLVSNTHNVGQFFTVGDTLVSYTYSDQSSNRASCSFTVTVTEDDNEPPICVSPDDIQLTIPLGIGGTTVTWIEPRATDNCGIVTLESRTNAPGDFFNIGRTRATFTFVDGSQNRVTCGFDILITEDGNECASNPCLNGGTCIDGSNGYACRCIVRWTGVNCEFPTGINECASSSCVNGACVDEINGYTCQCFAGWTGVNCETTINECASIPCRNGGQCLDEINGYTCRCIVGWTGVNCEFGPCASQPCVFGICYGTADGGGYECVCQDGYSGRNCDVLIRSCDSQPCVNENERCYENAGDGYICVCLDGYSGVNCRNDIEPPVVYCNVGNITEIVTNAQGAVVFWLEPTATDNSGSGVSSVRTHGPGSFFPVGLTEVIYTFTDISGNNAECFFRVLVVANTCAPNPCRNSGTCVETPFGGIRCFCPPGYTGDRCETAPPRPDPCASSPCLNGGACMNIGDNTDSFMCQCTPEFIGPTCNQPVTQFGCRSNPCSNEGGCVSDSSAPDGFVCNCQPGFFGVTCDIGPCFSSPCLNGGFCQDMVGQGRDGAMFACFCDVGFTGDRCEFDNIPPDVIACPTGIARTIDTGADGTIMTWTEPSATDNSGFAFIQSQTHFSGQSFFQYGSTEVTYTFSDNSNNLATCLFTVTIEERVPAPDPCVPSPCLNGGSCKVLLDNGFICFCTDGFEGDLCEIREMTLNLNSTQMEEFEDNYMEVINDLPDGMTLEGVLSDPVYYNRSVVPTLTEAQINMIMEEYGDIFIDEKVVMEFIDEEQVGQGRRRRQSMSQRICPVRYATRTNLVSISGNDRSTPNENAQLVQVNNMIQWAFNAECRQTDCMGVQTFNGAPCTCKEEMHIVSALVYNIQAGVLAARSGRLSMTLKQIEVYTCDGKFYGKI